MQNAERMKREEALYLFFAFCILHFAFCILHFAFCILRFCVTRRAACCPEPERQQAAALRVTVDPPCPPPSMAHTARSLPRFWSRLATGRTLRSPRGRTPSTSERSGR